MDGYKGLFRRAKGQASEEFSKNPAETPKKGHDLINNIPALTDDIAKIFNFSQLPDKTNSAQQWNYIKKTNHIY